MKTIIVMMSLILSANTFACQCAEYPLDPAEQIEILLKKNLGDDVRVVEMEIIKSYPTIYDRLALATGMRGTSCESKGPNGEALFHCSPKTVDKFEVTLVRASGNCMAIVKATATKKKVKAKLLSHDC